MTLLDVSFLLTLALFFTLLLVCGFRRLRRDVGPIIVIPLRKKLNEISEGIVEEIWEGVSVSWKGFFIALAMLIAAVISFVLLNSVFHLSCKSLLFLYFLMGFNFLFFVKVTNKIIEKSNGNTVTGTYFAIIFMQWCVIAFNKFDLFFESISIMPLLSLLSIVIVAFETVVRLGCLSSGCCNDKRIEDIPCIFRKLFEKFTFFIYGDVKKLLYASGFETFFFPIQAITSVVNAFLLLLTVGFFLNGNYTLSFLVGILGNLCWRFVSEFFRCNSKGIAKLSKFQWLSVLLIVYFILIGYIFFTSDEFSRPSLGQGIAAISKFPVYWIIIFITFVCLFIYYGLDRGIVAIISLHEIQKRK